MENGKRTACSNTAMVIDEEIRWIICEQLGLEAFDETAVGKAIESIEISGMEIALRMKPALALNTQAM